MHMVIIRPHFHSYRLSNKSYWVDPICMTHLITFIMYVILFFVGPTICLGFWQLQSPGQPFDVWPLCRPSQTLLFLETTCHFLKFYLSDDFGTTSSPNIMFPLLERNCNSRNQQDNNAKATNETPIIRIRMSSFLLY
jgi:hypothetical protein